MAFHSLFQHLKTKLAGPYMPVVPFLAGVTYDSLTLTRIDRLLDNLFLLLYVSLLGALIILTGRAQLRPFQPSVATTTPLHAWLMTMFQRGQSFFPLILQFLFGGLFSAYAVVYFHSASLNTTAVYFILILLLLVLNEFFRHRLSHLKILVTLYAFVTFTFLTYFLPVLTGWMHPAIFVMGAIISAIVVVRVVQLIYQNISLRDRRAPLFTSLPALAIIGILVGFYFLNWIPPVPLSLKFGGAYHEVTKTDEGYLLTFLEGPWYQPWKRSDDVFQSEGPIFCFTAVFAPDSFETTIFHHWQYRPSPKTPEADPLPFATTDRIPLNISGGREEGYRSYTVKQQIFPGEWQVDVETQDGRLIGRVRFTVNPQIKEEKPPLTNIFY